MESKFNSYFDVMKSVAIESGSICMIQQGVGEGTLMVYKDGKWQSLGPVKKFQFSPDHPGFRLPYADDPNGR